MQTTTSVIIPCITYRYIELRPDQRELRNFEMYTHRLHSIETMPRTIELPVQGIERNTLGGAELAQIQLFNEVYIPESNTKSIQLVFHDLDGMVYTCAPTVRGTLQVLSAVVGGLMPGGRVCYPDQDGEGDVYFATSTHTMVHDYAETHSGRCFHVGVSFLPVGPVFMPLWMCSARLARILTDWSGPKLEAAKRESLLVVRELSGRHSIRHVLSRAHEKHNLFSVA